jgi:uncharacterized membrane protein YjjP (DUF1212 family)
VAEDDVHASGTAEEPVGGILATRRGMSFRERFRAPDSYGLLLAAIGVVTISAGLLGSLAAPWRGVIALLLAGTLLFAFRTSRVSARIQRVAIGFVIVAVVAVAVASVGRSDRFATTVFGAVDALLAAAALVAILRRLAKHDVITGTTVAGAACSYLLIGLFFASVYTFLAGVSADPFFAETAAERSVDFLYFSFITLTTVGYGDFTAAGDLGRMLAAGEALTGQLFLVTVVALVVGNLGRARR